MVKHHILAFLASFLLSLPLEAAAPVLGPEVPLVPGMEVRAGAYGQAFPAAASNGLDHLVVWADSRRLSPDIYGTRVGPDGRPAEPLGRRIVTGGSPKLASAGGDYVLVWQTMSGLLQSMRLNGDGAPMSAPHDLGSGYPFALVSNGSTYLLVIRPSSGKPDSATILDRDGVPLRSLVETFTMTAGVATYGGMYYLVESGSSIALRSITQDGVVTHRPLPANPLATNRVIAAFAPGALLLASGNGYFMVAGYDGRVIKEPALLPLLYAEGSQVAAGWDGREFLAVYSLSGPGIVTTAFRIATDGTLLGAPLTPSKTLANGVTFASSEAGQLVVWFEFRDRIFTVVARAAPSFSTLTSEPTPSTVLTYSGEAQGDIQIARGPRGILTVWGDADRRTKVSASFNGGPPVTLQSTPGQDYPGAYIGWPAVLAGEHVFLVVWRHAALTAPGTDRLLAKRFDFDGKDLDPEPLVLLSQEPAFFSEFQYRTPPAPSIAFDGSSFLVAWIDEKDLFTIRVGEAGFPLREERFRVTAVLEAHSPRAHWTGTNYVISYDADNPCLLGSPPCTPAQTLFASRFGRTGTLESDLATPIFGYVGDTHLAAAQALDRITYAWVGYPNIMVAQATKEGLPLIAPRDVVKKNFSDGARNTEIAWSGSEFVLVWRELTPGVNSASYKLMAIRLDADLRPIDSAPFEVSSGPGPDHPAWLITTPSDVLIAYSRADDANGGAPRAFMRTLDRIPKPPHRRAAGR